MTIKPGDRIHSDKWLAHRPEGWEVRWVGAGRDQGNIAVDSWSNYLSYVPIADCTLVPRPFKVGDRVRARGDGTRGIVHAVIGDSFWVGYDNGDSFAYSPVDKQVYPIRIDPEASNA